MSSRLAFLVGCLVGVLLTEGAVLVSQWRNETIHQEKVYRHWEI